MCFFDQHRFVCGDHKWGYFRQHCANEYRTGETCGMKLVMQTLLKDEACKLCMKIETKQRRLFKEQSRIEVWRTENPKSRKASIQAAEETIIKLEDEIMYLQHQRDVARRTC